MDTLTARPRPDRFVFVYDGDTGLRALLLDVVKKAVGREDCALCELAYGPLGKRSEFRTCAARIGVAVDELHRDELPPEWGVPRSALPCVLGRVGDERPYVVLTRDEIAACGGEFSALEAKLVAALDGE